MGGGRSPFGDMFGNLHGDSMDTDGEPERCKCSPAQPSLVAVFTDPCLFPLSASLGCHIPLTCCSNFSRPPVLLTSTNCSSLFAPFNRDPVYLSTCSGGKALGRDPPPCILRHRTSS